MLAISKKSQLAVLKWHSKQRDEVITEILNFNIKLKQHTLVEKIVLMKIYCFEIQIQNCNDVLTRFLC